MALLTTHMTESPDMAIRFLSYDIEHIETSSQDMKSEIRLGAYDDDPELKAKVTHILAGKKGAITRKQKQIDALKKLEVTA